MMVTVNDAIKLEDNKQQFIGKPLSALLNQIRPQIKYGYGNPDNKWKGEVTFFINKEEYIKKNE